MLNKITIIGIGLIGGSLAKALKKNKFAKEIMGFGRNSKHLQFAQNLLIIDNWTTDIKTAIKGSDIIVLAAPVSSFTSILEQIKPYISNQIITDVGSTKQSVIQDVNNILGKVNFVPAHPIAGKEKTGFINADELLFVNKKVIITSSNVSAAIIKKMWQSTGAIVEKMNPKAHDNIFALTSHLPHLLAFSLVEYMATQENSKNYTGGGFKDFSRIASSDSKMWADICENNRDEILIHLENYQQELNKIKEWIVLGKKVAYQNYFKNAKNNRDNWIKKTNRDL